MATFKEIIYNIKNLRQAGRQSQDALLADSQYGFIIDYYRSVLIVQEYMKKKLMNPIWEQTLNTSFVRHTNGDSDIFKEMKVFKATDLPSVINTSYRPLYTGVRPSLLSPTITRSSASTIKNELRSPLTRRFPRYFPLGRDLYLVTPEPIKELFVTAVFESPFEVWKKNELFDPFDPYNFDYPISISMLDTLYKMMTDGEIKLSMLASNDIQADGVEEPVRQVPNRSTSNRQSDED